ncbi:MAG TPA: SMC family ATPase [Gemmatimonadaceae bacterium]|nr:SMC family ATPase [Gemmatimonadaceae bacterium]
MRLNSLQMVNFRQHADTRIEFDLGITGIIGPNGSGKSTILEAVAWALYGMPAARGTRDSIRFTRAGARAGVRVELDFDLGGHRYRVVRGLTSAELFLDGADAPIANSLTSVSELIRRRIGMSREEFFNTYFTGQKELSVMAAMGPSERAQFLSRVLGYERLRTAQVLVRDRRREIAAEIAGLRTGMPDPEAVARALTETRERAETVARRLEAAEARQRSCQEVLAGVAPRWDAMQRERDRLQELLAELRVGESEAAGMKRDLERIQRELTETATARAELEQLAEELTPLADIAAEFQHMEDLAREEGRRRTLTDAIHALDEDLTKLRDRRERIADAPQLEEEVTVGLEAKRGELEQAEGHLEARRTEWVRDRQEAETKRQALRAQYQDLREQRERLVAAGEEGICPTCARPLGGHFRSVLDLLDGQIETVRVDGNYYKLRIDQLEEMPDDVKALDEKRRATFGDVGALERRLAKVQLAVQEMSQVARDLAAKQSRLDGLQKELAAIPGGYDDLRHAELRLEISRLTPLDARAARLGAQIDREPQLHRERDRVMQAERELQATLGGLRARRDEIRFSEADYAALRAEHERCTQDLRIAELDAVTARGDVENARAARQAAEDAQRELAKIQQRLLTLQRDRRIHDELDRAYSDMRTDLNQTLRPEISELASAFLTELTDARYAELELDDQYNIIVLEEGVPKPVISGGEEDMANLVLRLAISQMIAERAGQAFSLLILDEIFGSLDEARRHGVIELLRRLQDRFEQVILITHIESVREGLDRVISVRYSDETGASVVEQSANGVTLDMIETTGMLEGAGAGD